MDERRGRRMAEIDKLIRPDVDRSLRRLPRLLRDALLLVWEADRRDVLLAVVLQVAGGAVLAAQLLVARSLLAELLVLGGADAAPAGSSLAPLRDLAPTLVALALLTAGSMFITAVSAERQRILSERVSKAALDRVIDAATTVDLESFESAGYHDHFTRAITNAQIRPYSIAQGLLGIGSSLVAGAGVAVVLAAIEPLFVPVILLGVIPLWLVNRANSKANYRFAHAMTPDDRRRLYLQHVLTDQEPAKEVRVYALAEFLKGRFEKLWRARFAELERLARLRLRRSLLAGLAYSTVLALAVVALVWLVLRGRISLADAGVAAVAVQQLGTQLRGIITGTSSLYESTLFLEDVTTFVELAPAVEATRPSTPAPDRFERVDVEGVSFTYTGTEAAVLHDLSFTIDAGEVVAVVGENGSGKTTLAKLLCNLYAPTEGTVAWDGVDLATYEPASVRARVAVIFQDFVKYELPAVENIGVGRVDRLDDRPGIERAARTVGAHQFLAGLEDGYDTTLSRAWLDGAELSVGQWQRVALARALFADAPLLVLDEPTAALDARAEADLFSAIRTLAAGRTVLLISHRFSSVRTADRILVLEHGRLTEAGTHADLMALGGHYAELFTLQAAAYLDETPAPMGESALNREE